MAGTDLLPLFVGLGAGAALLLGWAALGGGDGDGRFARRLERARLEVRVAAPRQGSVRRVTQDSGIPGFDRLLKRWLPNPDKLRRRLARTGRDISLGEYVLASLVCGLFAGALLWGLFKLPALVAVPAGIAAAIGLPHIATGFMAARRIHAFLESFPEAIDLIVRGLRSGLPVIESIVTVGKELPDPIGVEFRRIADTVHLGRSLDEALWEVAARLDTQEFKFFIIAMAIQRETGGNLAETLSNLSGLLRRRRQVRLKIRALSSEARASAWIIGSLPFLMFGVLLMLNPDYTLTLIRDPRGMMMTGVGLLFIGVGAGVMAKMVRFEI